MIPPRRILVVCLRRLGDVLLSTPIVRSLRRAYPDAEINALVFASTASMLEGNPDLNRVIAWPDNGRGSWKLALSLFRRYDTAFAVTASDRAHYLTFLAAGRRYANVQAEHPRRALLDGACVYTPDRLHTVVQNLRLLDTAAVPPAPEVVPPTTNNQAPLTALLGDNWRELPWAVIHPSALHRYKSWTHEGWRVLIRAMQLRGLRVAISGGPGSAERTEIDVILKPLIGSAGLYDCVGHLRFAEWTPLLRRARLFVGPDTSATHLAAACGTPTLALFGPSSPLAWGPWPQGWIGSTGSPWQLTAAHQRQGNVMIVQGGPTGRRGKCVPCLAEGCDGHRDSPSDCLDQLTPLTVIEAADQLLASGPGGRAPA